MERGKLRLVMGNMFANKTGTIIHAIETMRTFGHRKVLIFTPTTDTRAGKGAIKNYNGQSLRAVDLLANRPNNALRIIRKEEAEMGSKFHTIVFDEVQFFSPPRVFYQLTDELLRLGYDVLASGLRLDFRGEPFGVTLSLIGLCESMQQVTLLASYCAKCGNPAHLPQRLLNGVPAPYLSPQVKVGGKESYEARCYDCYELPGRQRVS